MLRLALWLLLALASASSLAHEQKPAIVDMHFLGDGKFTLSVQLNLAARMAGIGAEHDDTDDAPQAREYDRLRALPLAEFASLAEAFEPSLRASLGVRFGGEPASLNLEDIVTPAVDDLRLSRPSTLKYQGQFLGTGDFVWRYPAEYGDSVLRVTRHDQSERMANWLKAGSESVPLAVDERLQQRALSTVVWEYIVLGFEHILPKGLDHILFVLGLFLLSIHWRPLLWQVTAFTFAHTVTLALTILGYISLSPSIVEPLIALSIAYVGIENLLTKQLHVWRTVIVFIFGLLHGMGFASVLTDLGLPEREWVSALISFNVGVELGQLTVILAAFIATLAFRVRPTLYRRMIVLPGSLLIALIGLYWTWERVWG